MNELQGIAAANHFKQQYEELRKQHEGLPTLATLDDAFSLLDNIEREKITSSIPIRFAIGSALRWINGWTGMLHDLLLPNQQNAIAMQEAASVSEPDRAHVHEVIDWIMYRNRTWTLLLVQRDDEQEARFLTELTQEWVERRERLSVVLRKIRGVWEQRMRGVRQSEEKINYTG